MRALDLDPIELLTPAEMGCADSLTIQSGTPGYSLMLRAGKNVAAAASDMLRANEGGRIAIYCGPGNNGGDGYVAGRLLREQGFEVAIGALGDPLALRGDAAQAFSDWGGTVVAAETLYPPAYDLIIDALFGAGLSRPLDGAALAIVQRINGSGAPVLAVDVPSGLDGANGAIGSQCVQARETVTFFRLKPGHVLMPGRRACGNVRLTQIGIEDEVLREIAPKAFLNAPALWRDSFPWPNEAGHKYERGHLVVASGPAIRTGAARLAARAGLRVGAGLVTLASPPEALAVNAAHLTAIMLRSAEGPAQWRELLADRRFSAVVIGPAFGVGEATAEIVETILASAGKDRERPFGLVLDADALTSFQSQSDRLGNIIRNSGAQVALTPHEGEFSRLFSHKDKEVDELGQGGASSSTSTSQIQTQPSDFPCKIDRARAAAGATGAFVVLKGPDTVVASPDGRAGIARNAPPTLATAGSGDVLAGLIGGLLAQGMEGFEACACAVWLHGEAANLFGPGLIAEDLPEILPQALANLALR
ncbi:NAD(P)H-hydrate dehydratase [Rhodoblastus acidophilus]|uniref:Bifunctional NAD(P)H-hydrate repair enzyme n=1 Tax=Candidatus Rhodoblastus alkanivorans TaxID=2954117 RepID=A0ABS9Z5A6_9HYPH|nr:NAD(P)H-hydrate dehydratase [Candidatus Rhodoblastus alkanivorans]MCI4678469.1 NAD(P)H-hydrate dehydratase [Candidatus Rhodoblastus alkanivorans]MCI4682858.1 NAD(P)H-hydrate dehydratase [Candidatus Rhodoblastus alkanivorans]MDI4640167.1 NAD(P)H-hydrate dehydratase [Rhodoblastus acidophilus]